MIAVEIRKKIVEAYEKGIKAKEISHVLGVGLSTVYSMIERNKRTGSLEASYPGRQPKITKKQIEEMKKLVNKQPDITLEEIIEKLNLPIKKSQVNNILHKLGFSFKKKQYMQASRKEMT